jgi:hypothetical protein
VLAVKRAHGISESRRTRALHASLSAKEQVERWDGGATKCSLRFLIALGLYAVGVSVKGSKAGQRRKEQSCSARGQESTRHQRVTLRSRSRF